MRRAIAIDECAPAALTDQSPSKVLRRRRRRRSRYATGWAAWLRAKRQHRSRTVRKCEFAKCNNNSDIHPAGRPSRAESRRARFSHSSSRSRRRARQRERERWQTAASLSPITGADKKRTVSGRKSAQADIASSQVSALNARKQPRRGRRVGRQDQLRLSFALTATQAICATSNWKLFRVFTRTPSRAIRASCTF